MFGVEFVDEFEQFVVVESVVAEQVSNMRPVFLFNMGVVVFLVGS